MEFSDSTRQDRAAGGEARRKLRIRSGDIVTVSLSVSGKSSPYRVILRFKSGLTIQRPVAAIDAESPAEALRIGWARLRDEKIAEGYGWEWLSP